MPTHFPQATTAPDAADVQVDTVASGLQHPWSLAFLPDGRMLVTERPGRLRIVSADGRVSPPVQGVPPVQAQGQGGLLDVALDPAFATNRTLYLSFAEPGEGGAGTAVARAVLDGAALKDLRVIYRQTPKVGGGNHFGSRLVFGRDGTLFITQGDRFSERERAQDLSVTIGKIVRIRTDGSIPPDNPFVQRKGARPEIWSYGHRNVQGAALDPNGQLWTAEHGAQGGDEINRPGAGRNHGWPVITYGRDYSGAKIGIGTAAAGMEQPVHYFDPSIAPSGMAFYTGDKFPGWKGDLLVGSLKFTHLARLQLRDGRVVAEMRYLEDLQERIRDVRQGPDGFVYLLTDSADGRLLRLRPAR
ncbi:PQQ-dependent sugar dehydrogenase [Ideonella sp. BN130291]|uniref:PQQ-dependent sugar dehydrogenase n=1 Tax=Ideonella sp. BN130291 TaxID=3112940 RepID=UPI002E25AC7D|nr:PQQ-dependent sugar dehydrogenase [Ideonella sp. BN130291]